MAEHDVGVNRAKALFATKEAIARSLSAGPSRIARSASPSAAPGPLANHEKRPHVVRAGDASLRFWGILTDAPLRAGDRASVRGGAVRAVGEPYRPAVSRAARARGGTPRAGAGCPRGRARSRVLVQEYRARLQAAESSARLEAQDQDDASLAALQLRTVRAQREALARLRARRLIGDDAFHAVEEEIDLLELTAHSRVRPAIERYGS